MFITHEIDPGEMLAELLRGRKVSREATKAFATQRHDRDLCPTFARQLNTMLDVYRAYGQEVHDIQGMRDDGVDVLLRYELADGTERKVGLQIKSDDEFVRWGEKKLQLPQIVKAQYASATNNLGLHKYYLLLCVDDVAHRKRIRSLCSELKEYKDMVIVEPQDLLDLYEMSSIDVCMRATRLLCHNDTVLKTATEEMNAIEVDVAFVTVSLVCRAFSGELDFNYDDLVELWGDWLAFAGMQDQDEDRLAAVVSDLLASGLAAYWEIAYRLQLAELPRGLAALYFDLQVRMPDTSVSMREQLLGLLDLEGRLRDEAEG